MHGMVVAGVTKRGIFDPTRSPTDGAKRCLHRKGVAHSLFSSTSVIITLHQASEPKEVTVLEYSAKKPFKPLAGSAGTATRHAAGLDLHSL